MNKNELLAYAVVFILAAGVLFCLWNASQALQATQYQSPVSSIPAEYKSDYGAAKAMYQEWIEGASKERQAEIRYWAWHDFGVPLPVVRRYDLFVADFIDGCREEYMRTHNIYEIDELEGL